MTWFGFQFQLWMIERPCTIFVTWLYIFILILARDFHFHFAGWELSSHFIAEIFHFLVPFLTSSALTSLLLFFKLNPIASICFFFLFPSIALCQIVCNSPHPHTHSDLLYSFSFSFCSHVYVALLLCAILIPVAISLLLVYCCCSFGFLSSIWFVFQKRKKGVANRKR